MSSLPPTIDASIQRLLAHGGLDLGEMEAVRLILRGGSVIDWHRAHFHSLEQVDRFLSLHLLDMSDPEDRRRLRFVHGEAVNYLEEHLDLHFPPSLVNTQDPRQLFLLASEVGGFRRTQIQACVILKLMHVINHMEAAELHFQTPLSEADLLDCAERRIVKAADRMRRDGFPLIAFYGSRKTRNSVITKLLAKRENIAATIFDKLRFRIVTESQDQVLPAVAWLSRELVPFNLTIPGESHNNLLDLRTVFGDPVYQDRVGQLQSLLENEGDPFNPEENPFSGHSYRMINFIVDFPVRVDELYPGRYGPLLGRSVYVLVEFQVLDQATARLNEEGENSHRLYKLRQRSIVERRLKKGGRWKRQSR